jgi:uncharacterized membrane protein YccC
LRKGRTPGWRTTKTTLAAVLSFVIADLLHTSDAPILAPLTALLVVQLTMYETLTHGLDRVASVVVGVLVAVGIATVTGLTWWSLGLVVAVSLVIGRLLRLGPNLLEVPISGMLVLAVGGAEQAATGRVVETFIGAIVGVLLTALIPPPLYLQPAEEAIGDLAQRMAGFSRDLASAMRGEWSRQEAERWLNRARELGSEVARADRSLARAEESARLNPRGKPARVAQPRLRQALTGLEHTYVVLRNLGRALLDRTFSMPDEEQGDAYDQDTRSALADVLEAAAPAMESVVPVAAGDGSAHDARHDVVANLDELHRQRQRLSSKLLVDPHVDPGAWEQHGALLAAVDRLGVEIDSATRPPDVQWRPPSVARRPRQAVRRIITAATPRGPRRQDSNDR